MGILNIHYLSLNLIFTIFPGILRTLCEVLLGIMITLKVLTLQKVVCDDDLQKIADLNLFNRIFLGLDPLDEANECVDEIKRSLTEPSRIQIIADSRFFIPWSLLYEEDLSGKGIVTKEAFWGFKHVIEQMPVIHKRWNYGARDAPSSVLRQA